MDIKQDIMTQTDLSLTKTYSESLGFYFVTAHTIKGTRFYSDSIATFEQAEKIFDSYVDVITYFSGGYVQMYKINENNYDIIAYVKI